MTDMKTNQIVLQTLCISLCLVSLCASAHLIASRTVAVAVEEKIKRKTAASYTVAESVTLQITLRGKALTPDGRTVKWTAYGRDRKDRAISVLSTGESKVDLATMGMQKVELVDISTTSIKDHSISKTSGRGRSRRATAVRVEGSGVQYVGYGVQVFEGEDVVGEKFGPDSLEGAIEVK